MPMSQELLEKLKAKLGVGSARVYSLIASKASKMALPRHLAIFLVASDYGINYQKYATYSELDKVRAAISAGNGLSIIPAAESSERMRRRPGPARRAAKRSKANDNSVFVVYGRDDGLRKSM